MRFQPRVRPGRHTRGGSRKACPAETRELARMRQHRRVARVELDRLDAEHVQCEVPLPLGPDHGVARADDVDRGPRELRRRGVDRRLTAQLRRELRGRTGTGARGRRRPGRGSTTGRSSSRMRASPKPWTNTPSQPVSATRAQRNTRSRAGTSGIVRPPSECPTTIASSTPSSAARTTAAYSSIPASQSSHGRSGATTRWPRASSSARSGSQAHPPCQAPCTKPNVATPRS